MAAPSREVSSITALNLLQELDLSPNSLREDSDDLRWRFPPRPLDPDLSEAIAEVRRRVATVAAPSPRDVEYLLTWILELVFSPHRSQRCLHEMIAHLSFSIDPSDPHDFGNRALLDATRTGALGSRSAWLSACVPIVVGLHETELLELMNKRSLVSQWLSRQREGSKLVVPRLIAGDPLESALRAGASLLVGGFDVSFVKDTQRACACLVVMRVDLKTNEMSVISETYRELEMTQIYLSGFLGQRESAVCAAMARELRVRPHVLLMDGCGVLHPRGFGSASQTGVGLSIPTIGVSKTLMAIDGLDRSFSRSVMTPRGSGFFAALRGASGAIHGAALVAHAGYRNPVFVSVGHLIDLETAVQIVERCSLHRVPEPIRLADVKSREALR